MIQIKTFQHERGGDPPKWKEPAKWLEEEKIERSQIISVTAYPTARFHNLVFVYDDNPDGKTDPVAPE